MMDALDQPEAFRAMYRLLQAHFGHDQGQLLAKLHVNKHNFIDETFYLEMNLRALFHTNERYRKEATSVLLKTIRPVDDRWIKSCSEPFNVFMFENPLRFYEQLENEMAHTDNWRAEEIVEQLRRPVDVEIGRGLLRHVKNQLVDSMFREDCTASGMVEAVLFYLRQIPMISTQSLIVSWYKAAKFGFQAFRVMLEAEPQRGSEFVRNHDLMKLLSECTLSSPRHFF